MKKLVILLFVLCFLVGVSGQVQAQTEKTYGEILHDLELITGSDGDLKEDKQITREEMVTILVRLAGDKKQFEQFEAPQKPTFQDVPSSHWAYKNIEYAYYKGLTSGVDKGVFGLKQKISYNQASLFLLRSLGYDGKEIDFSRASEQIGEKYGLKLQNKEVGKAFLKRDQVFELMAKTLLMKPKDVAKTKLEVIEADADKINHFQKDIKLAKPLPNKVEAKKYYHNEFIALDLSLLPGDREGLIQDEYVREAYQKAVFQERQMRKFIQEYLTGSYHLTPLQQLLSSVKTGDYKEITSFYECSELYLKNGKLDANLSGITLFIHDPREDQENKEIRISFDISSGLGRASGVGTVEEIRRYQDKNGFEVYAVLGTEEYTRYNDDDDQEKWTSYFYVAFTVDKNGNIVETIGSTVYGTGYGQKTMIEY